MKLIRNHRRGWVTVYDADYDVLSAELWAAESLVQLEEMLVMGSLVHRDYSKEFAEFGETVNVDRPGVFEWNRMDRGDSVTDQQGTAERIPVKLNQHFEVTFTIYDRDEQKSFRNLVDYRMKPAMRAAVEGLERCIIGQVARLTSNGVGTLGAGGKYSDVTDLGMVMDQNLVPAVGRNLVISPKTKRDLLNIDNFVQAHIVADGGEALRTAAMGERLGFNFYMSQMVPSIGVGNTTSTGAVNNASGYDPGDTVLTVDGITGEIEVGTYCTIENDGIVHIVTDSSDTAGNTTSITISPGLRKAVKDNDVITFYTPGAVNNSDGYPKGYLKGIKVDGFTVAPKLGHMVNFGDPENTYTIVKYKDSAIWLDRPLEVAIADDDLVCISPAGEYNLAFNRNAIALVNRPLAIARAGTGVNQAFVVTEDESFSVRVTISYDAKHFFHRVSIDTLFGIQVLDANQTCLYYA